MGAQPSANASTKAQRFERALEGLRSVVYAKGQRMSSVRVLILRAALEREGHFDVPSLAEGLRVGRRKISVQTVYRNMPLMVEAHIVAPTLLSQGTSHLYEVTFERFPHDHLVCETCGAVIEFHLEAFASLRRDVAGSYAFTLRSHVHEMLGQCATCSRAAQPKPRRTAARMAR